MSDTVDRLVRMLDEERGSHRREREHAANLASRLHTADIALHNAKSAEREARVKIKELERWIDALYEKVPEKDRKGWGKKPGKFDDIPF